MVRATIALILVGSFILYPWTATGPLAFDASDPHLVYVTPTSTGGVIFNQLQRQVSIIASSTGGPRADLVTSESSYSFSADAEILSQRLSPIGDWYWVSSNAPVPWPSAYFRVLLQAGTMTSLDVAAVDVSVYNGSSLFATNFTLSGKDGWSLSNSANFVNIGSPQMLAINLKSNSTALSSATSTSYQPISPDSTLVTVSALIRFDGTSGPFKIETDWYRTDHSYIRDQTDYDAWLPYLDLPAALTLRIWYPTAVQDARLRFAITSTNSGNIFFELVNNGLISVNDSITSYTIGETFHLTAYWNRLSSIGLSLANDTRTLFTWSSMTTAPSSTLSSLTKQSQMDLSASAEGFSSDSVLLNPSYVYPGSSRYVSLAANSYPLITSIIILVVLFTLWSPEEKKLWNHFRRRVLPWTRTKYSAALRTHTLPMVLLASAALAYVYVALSFGGHPFDSAAFKTWTYGGKIGGLRGIWTRSTSVPDSFDRNGTAPWSSITFAYLPLASYWIIFMSTVVSFGPYSTQESMLGSAPLQGEIKLLLAAFTIAAAAVSYAIVLRTTGNRNRAILAMLLLVLNPAILFDSAAWGETDSMLYLAFIIFGSLAYNRPGAALTAFLVAVDVKQTGVMLLLPTILMLTMPGQKVKYWIVRSGKGGSVLLATIIPLVVSGILPSALYKPLFEKLADIGTSLGNATPSLSADTYTVWTTFTGPFGRIDYPSNSSLFAGISFSILGYIAFAALSLYVILKVRKKAPVADRSFWFGLVAFSSLTFNAVLTGGASRYYSLTIPSLICMMSIGWNRFSKREKRFSVIVLGLVTFLSIWTMVGILGYIMANEYPNIYGLELYRNPVMAFVNQYYANGIVITLGSIASATAVFLMLRLVLSLSNPKATARDGRVRN